MALSAEDVKKKILDLKGGSDRDSLQYRTALSQASEVVAALSPEDLQFLELADVPRLLQGKGIIEYRVPTALKKLRAEVATKASEGDVKAQQRTAAYNIAVADGDVKDAEKSGNPEKVASAEAQRQSILQQATYADAVKTAKALIQDDLTVDEYKAGKKIFEEENQLTLTDAEWQTRIQVRNPEAALALKIAKGAQDDVEWTIKLPGKERKTVGSLAIKEAISGLLPGAGKNSYVVNELMVRGAEDADIIEAQWMPLLAAAHGILDDGYGPETTFTGDRSPVLLPKAAPGKIPTPASGFKLPGASSANAAEATVLGPSTATQPAGQAKRLLAAEAIAAKFSGYLTKYGKANPLAAFIATFDEDLANRMNTEGLESKELAQLGAKYLKGVDLGQLGITSDALKFYSKDAKKAEKGPTIVLPDREKIADGFRELYRSWFRTEPEDGELQALIDQVRGQYASDVASNISPDVGAKMKALARGSSLYEQLMGSRPRGVGEEEYVGQFAGAGQQLLGGAVAPDAAVQAGMRSGDINTTVGSIYANKQLLETNSTLRERIARAAQAINELT